MVNSDRDPLVATGGSTEFGCKWTPRLRLWLICLAFGIFGMVPTRIATFFPNNAQETMEAFLREEIYGNATGPGIDTAMSVIWAAFTSQSGFSCTASALLAPLLGDRLGRPKSVGVAFGIAIPGFAFEALSRLHGWWPLLFVGQFLVNVSAAFSYVVLPTFISESSPPGQRGTFGSIQFIGVAGGTLLASILSLPEILGNDDSWPYGFLICFFLAIPAIPVCFLIRETPVFLAVAGKHAEGKLSLDYYRGTGDTTEAEWENVLIDAASKQKGLKPGFKAFQRLWTLKPLREPLKIAMVIAVAYSVPLLMNSYSTPMFQTIGFDHRTGAYLTLGMKFISILSFVICTMAIDRYGRRPLVIGGLIGSTISWLVLTLCQLPVDYGNLQYSAQIGVAVIFCIGVYGAQISVNAGIRPVYWILVPETFPFQFRVTAKAFAVGFCGIYTFFLLFGYFILLRVLPFMAHLVVALTLLACAIFCYINLPETKKRAPHEIYPQLLQLCAAKDINENADGAEERDEPFSASEETPLKPKRLRKTYT